MKSKRSWPQLQQPATCPSLPPYFFKIHFSIILTSLHSFRFLHQTIYSPLLSPTRPTYPMWTVHIIMLHIMHSPPPHTQISPSSPYSATPSADVLRLVWETKFHTHIKQSTELLLLLFQLNALTSNKHNYIVLSCYMFRLRPATCRQSQVCASCWHNASYAHRHQWLDDLMFNDDTNTNVEC
jgi:hypothetical protein